MKSRALITIFLIILTDIIGFGIIIPLFPTISTNLGISGFSLGLLSASYALAQFIAAPILGSLSDKYGRKPILIISKAGTVVAYIMLAFTGNFLVLILSRLIDGFTGGNIPVARAYISDVTTKENRSKGMAIIGIAFGLGFILGPAIGGIFYSIFHTVTAPALVGAGLSLLSLVLTFLFLDESHRQGQVNNSRPFTFKNFIAILKHPEIKSILIIQFFLMVVMAGFQSSLVFFTDEVFGLQAEQNSWLFVYIGIVSLIVQGTLVRKSFANLQKVTLVGLIIYAISTIFISLSPNLIFLGISLAISAIGSGLVGVTLPTMLSTTSSTDPEGEIQGAFEGISSLGRVVGPAIAASFIVSFPRQVIFISALLLAVTTLPIMIKSVNATKNH